jgi:hypothetical protein
MVQSLIRGLAKWPTVDLAQLLLAIKEILDSRAEHQQERGKGKRVASGSKK